MSFLFSLILLLRLANESTYAATIHPGVFFGNFIQLHCTTSPDISVLNHRFSSVISHQNQLRKQKNIPLLDENPTLNYTEDKTRYLIDTPNAFPDYPIMGEFIVSGNTILRGFYNDLFSLNYVYEFDGYKLVNLESYGSWYLKHYSEEFVFLYRQMSPKEYELWKKRQFNSLGSDWGYNTSVIHFSTDRDFTTAASPVDFPKIEVRISKKILLNELKNYTIWSGILNQETMISEFVIPANRIENLVANDSLRFLD